MDLSIVLALCTQVAVVSVFATLRYLERKEALALRDEARRAVEDTRKAAQEIVPAHNALMAKVAELATASEHLKVQVAAIVRRVPR